MSSDVPGRARRPAAEERNPDQMEALDSHSRFDSGRNIFKQG